MKTFLIILFACVFFVSTSAFVDDPTRSKWIKLRRKFQMKNFSVVSETLEKMHYQIYK